MKKIPWGWVIVVLILIYVGALTLPYVAHKKVSSTFVKDFEKRSFTNDQAGTERVSYLNDNVEALLYRLRMAEEAKKKLFFLPLILTLITLVMISWQPCIRQPAAVLRFGSL